MIRDLVIKNRSRRRFYQDTAIEEKTLRELVDLARLAASAANMQPLKYILSCESEKNALIFPHLAWAAYLKDWDGPSEGEKPSGYIVILKDKELSKHLGVGCDHGIAAQSILLGAAEMDLGGCIIASVKKEALRSSLEIPPQYDVHLVIALGKPKEKVIIDPVDSGGNIKYWHDGQGVHHVPKRSLDDIIIG